MRIAFILALAAAMSAAGALPVRLSWNPAVGKSGYTGEAMPIGGVRTPAVMEFDFTCVNPAGGTNESWKTGANLYWDVLDANGKVLKSVIVASPLHRPDDRLVGKTAHHGAEVKPELFDVAGAKSVRFRMGVGGAWKKGDLADVVEFSVAKDGAIVKPRSPEINGDIPAEFSFAGTTLKRSFVKWTAAEDGMRGSLHLASGDLYPFLYDEARRIRLSIRAAGKRDYAWGEGYGRFIEAAKFGSLEPSGGVRRETTGKRK